MPIYAFYCPRCEKKFDDLCSYEKLEKVRCPKCKKKPEKLVTTPGAIVFTNPKGTSKEDNFDYVAKTNYAQAEALRRAAEAQQGKPYKEIDDSAYEGKIV